ncbi:hypothetical protein JCM8097_006327 [Rhodosporidiobolus ruineniae]
MSADPLHDPLAPSYAQAAAAEAPAEPDLPAWKRDDLFAEPFSTNAWARTGDEERASAVWGDADAGQRDGSAEEGEGEPAAVEPADEEQFSYPTPASPPKSTLRSSLLRADAPAFAPSSTPSTSEPVEISPPASSLRRSRSSSTSGLLPPSSVTPRAADSPLSRKVALEPATEEDSPATPTSAAAPCQPTPSTPPSSSSALSPSRPTPNRQASTASSSKGYDPTVLRNLIATACSNGDLDRLKSLISSNASEDGPSVFTLVNQASPHTGLAPIHLAAQRGHVEVVQWLVEEAGAMPELEDLEGETALHKAADLDVVRTLISRGVDIDAADADGWTPLHVAASKGRLEISRLLLDAGASVDQQSKRGYTALQNAAVKGRLPLVHFLLKQGANPLLRNTYGETAFDLAASVFETAIARVLAEAEAARYIGEDSTRDPYNPLDLHSTVPIVLYENQRLALPTLKKLSSLGGLAGAPKWTAKALSRNDGVAAFSMPPLLGTESKEPDLPCFRSEVGLPVVGNEGELVLPERRTVRSGGRVQVTDHTPRPATSRRGSAASSSLNAVLASSSSSSAPLSPSTAPSNTTSSTSSAGAPAWLWSSNWTVDTTDPSSSPADGWSYASSFSAPSEAWTAEPPIEVLRALETGTALTLAGQSGKKWVRRRQWVRIMRRRVDLPDWGFADLPPFPRRPTASRRASATSTIEIAADASSPPDYRSRAQFLAGSGHSASSASIRSQNPSPDRAELKKAAARLERAADELRKGMVSDNDGEDRRKAESELEAFLRQLALVRAELGSAADELDDEGDSDDEFIYSGRDAGEDDDDARSIWTSAPTARPGSDYGEGDEEEREPLASSSTTPAAGFGRSDYFAQPFAAGVDDDHSHPDLTPQLARAPDFRVPTHETAPPLLRLGAGGGGGAHGPAFQPRPVRPRWEPDEATNECRRCSKRFSLFNRKHHCRRCGLVVCAACSPHSDQLDPYTVALEPGTWAEEEQLQPWLTGLAPVYRTCTDCHAAVSLPTSLGGGVHPASLLSPQAFFPASPSLGSVTPSEAAASDASELAECPVCGTTLATLGSKAQQEDHVRDCLERGGGSISSGRYLVFTLPPGPLVGEECRVCFEEFELGDKMARLVCLCTFHQTCIAAWLSRGHSCPIHPTRED